MQDLLLVFVSGVSIGAIYGLMGLTFTAIYNSSKVINFATGEFGMLGAVLSFYFLSQVGLPFPVSFVGIMIIAGAIGLGMYVAVLRHLLAQRAPPISINTAVIAISFVIPGGVMAIVGYRFMRVDPYVGLGALRFAGVSISYQHILVISVTALLVLIFWFLLHRTRFGRALRATGYDKEGAEFVGIPTWRIIGLSFFISSSMGGIAGLLIAPLVSPNAGMGIILTLKGFIAALIGGLGNPYAALLGGLILGLMGTFLTGYLSSAHAEAATCLLLLVVLTLRPQGILGVRE